MKKNKKWVIFIVALCLFVIAISFQQKIKNGVIFYFGIIKSRVSGKSSAKCQNCNVLFTDGIATHELAYKKGKIVEQETDAGLLNLEQKKVLKGIQSNDFYYVRNLKHSQPLLLPKAVDFLNKLSILYQKKCSENQQYYVPFVITSATRSKKSIKNLQHKNSNAIENSPHLRGKTFDISYTAFTINENQLKLFITALSELKHQNECFVKYERNGCLHITVN